MAAMTRKNTKAVASTTIASSSTNLMWVLIGSGLTFFFMSLARSFSSVRQFDRNGFDLEPSSTTTPGTSKPRQSPSLSSLTLGRRIDHVHEEEEEKAPPTTTAQPQRQGQTGGEEPKSTLGQDIVQRSYDETWSKFVSICTPERIHQLDDDFVARKQQIPSQFSQQKSPIAVSTKMRGLRQCLQYVLQISASKSSAAAELKEHGDGGEEKVGGSRNPVDDTAIRNWPWWLRTMIRDMEIPKNGLFGLWHQLQFDHPRNLELCVYEKGGTKKFRAAHCLNVNDDTVPKDPRKRSSCYLKQRQFEKDDVTDRAVFLRDPLDRFLSGFLDKCVRRGDNVDHCEPTTVFFNASTSPVTNMLDDTKLLFDMYVDTLGLKFNMHFFPQALQCGGLYHSLDEYKFVGSLGTNFYRDLTTLSKMYPEIEDDFEQTFALSKRGSGDNNGGVETNAANQVLEYYTPRTIRRVLQYYAIDYVTLNLSIPEWAEGMLREDEGQRQVKSFR